MPTILEFRFLKTNDRFKWFKKPLQILCYICLFFTLFLSFTLAEIRPFNYFNIAVFGCFCIFTLLYIFLFGKVILDYFVILIFLFLICQYIATIVNFIPSFSLTGTLISFMSLFVYEYLRQLNNSKKIFLIIFVAAGTFFLVAFFIKYFFDIFHPSLSSNNRIGTFFGNQNDVARHLSYISLSFLVLFIVFKKLLIRVFSILLSLVSLYFILLTGSISNVIAIAFITFFYFFIILKGKFRFIYLACCLVSCFAVILILQFPALTYYKNRLLNMINAFFGNVEGAGVDNSFVSRFKGALYGIKLFFQNPLFGNGYDSVYRNFYIMAHNNVVEVAADFGLFGLITHECILLTPIFFNKKKRPEILLLLMFTVIFQLFLVSFDSKIDSMIVPFCYLFVSKEVLTFVRKNPNYSIIEI